MHLIGRVACTVIKGGRFWLKPSAIKKNRGWSEMVGTLGVWHLGDAFLKRDG